MKTLVLKLTLLLAGTLLTLAADETAPPAGTNGTAGVSTNQTADAEKKPDIKKIFASSSVFTNAAGLVIQKISSTLWVSRTEVTQQALKKAGAGNPSAFPGDQNPVENISWNDAVGFCQRLTDYERREELLPEGFAYWLPTQAQWESFASGATPDTAVTSDKTPRQSTAPVGSLAPNGLGLVDVLGNVWEWTADKNPTYDYRVARGAAWNTWLEVELRPAFRVYKNPTEAANNIGFRVVLIPADEAKVK
jgi:formylglycine-generating enzyme required for sulfatase activity